MLHKTIWITLKVYIQVNKFHSTFMFGLTYNFRGRCEQINQLNVHIANAGWRPSIHLVCSHILVCELILDRLLIHFAALGRRPSVSVSKSLLDGRYICWWMSQPMLRQSGWHRWRSTSETQSSTASIRSPRVCSTMLKQSFRKGKQILRLKPITPRTILTISKRIITAAEHDIEVVSKWILEVAFDHSRWFRERHRGITERCSGGRG